MKKRLLFWLMSYVTLLILLTMVSQVQATYTGGTPEADFSVDIYKPDKVCSGTTLLSDNHNLKQPRIIEVNMAGEVIWQYRIPMELRRYTNPGFDSERLPNNHILFVLPAKGVYEINREGKTVWSYLDVKISHDADRLANGNTLIVFGNKDTKNDAQVKEIDAKGKMVWSWYAKQIFDKVPYNTINNQGWTHTNAAERLIDGNTLISLRNFNQVIIISSQGKVLHTYGKDLVQNPHDPQRLPNGNILMAAHPLLAALEVDGKTGDMVWKFTNRQWGIPGQGARDADRLPNGNTLITGTTKIIEVTKNGEIVWQFGLNQKFNSREEASAHGFYKAERISYPQCN